MRIGIIDAELSYCKRHRFPNLASMKIAGYHKSIGDTVELILDDAIWDYDKVYISKVFTDTVVPPMLLLASNVEYGGTGFYYDKAPSLSNEIEHTMPDYSLYNEWVEQQIEAGESRTSLKFYLDYSIGYLTRGCFRGCSFCVNRNERVVSLASPLEEFFDPSRKKICLLDDNFFGCSEWERLLDELNATGKRFVFKQGLDERLLNDKRAAALFSAKYDGDYIFAFDDVNDYNLISEKLDLIRRYTNRVVKFYVLVGFDRSGKYDEAFYKQDIIDAFKRIALLSSKGCLPYIMRHADYEQSPYRGLYINFARWCNQPSLFKKLSFREFCTHKTHKGTATERYFNQMLTEIPEAEKFIDLRFGESCPYEEYGSCNA